MNTARNTATVRLDTLPAVEARHLTFTYPGSARPALDRVNVRVTEGSFTGLLGPNGAGKTTFVNLLSGLLAPDSGALTVFGSASLSRAARRATGICPQELAVYPKLTARENLRFFGRLTGLRGRRLAVRVDACLDTARLGAEAKVRVGRFSGGMKRRLNLAVALLNEPRLLLLDEPTAGVDAQSRLAIFETLEELCRSGTTILYTTHYMEEVERLCQEVVVIDHGRVLAAEPTAELVARDLRTQTLRVTLRPASDAGAVARHANDLGLRVEMEGPSILLLSGDDPRMLLAEVARLSETGDLQSYETRRPSLEEDFLQLTGRELRD